MCASSLLYLAANTIPTQIIDPPPLNVPKYVEDIELTLLPPYLPPAAGQEARYESDVIGCKSVLRPAREVATVDDRKADFDHYRVRGV